MVKNGKRVLSFLGGKVREGVGAVQKHYSHEAVLGREQKGLELEKIRLERARIRSETRKHQPPAPSFGDFGGGGFLMGGMKPIREPGIPRAKTRTRTVVKYKYRTKPRKHRRVRTKTRIVYRTKKEPTRSQEPYNPFQF